ncbi:MAG: BrnA antitoxin family protein [Roseiarcus sp.]|uniref:BrnA antitoxin family protein n=1 Tax=Roseiarcus sp. TaxID=1969460 RepID=UPI003BAE2CA1
MEWGAARRFFSSRQAADHPRLDADLIDWFKRHRKPDKGYQTTINQALREYVVLHDRD